MNNLFTIGLHYRHAPIAVRERLAFAPDQQRDAINTWLKTLPITEAFILSTCHRTEITVYGEDLQTLKAWLASQGQLSAEDFEAICYQYQGKAAVRHLIRVAVGLDSVMLGEPQILGQLKESYRTANTAGGLGVQLQPLLDFIFNASKQIRTQSEIGRHALSVAYVATRIAKQIFANIHETRVLFIGTGETINLVAQHLSNDAPQQCWFAGRQLEKAQSLVDQVGGQAIRIQEVPSVLPQADIIISATRSSLPIIGKGLVESSLKKRKHNPMLFIDLANPRDVEPEVSSLEDVYLYNLDDLAQVISKNQSEKQVAASHAESLLDQFVEQYVCDKRARSAAHLVKNYREQGENIRNEVLEKMLRKLAQGDNPEEVLNELAHALTNKLLHQTSVQLHKAAYQGEDELLDFAKSWLTLE
ncbi:MAG: glutamyl-tRNA reductase [marine bacterium B5-7]|nr:MAG: glutamyl-tRNA reductase [marine bacterium B5-7]